MLPASLRRFRQRLIEGSVGAEIWSSVSVASLAVVWSFSPPLHPGTLLLLIADRVQLVALYGLAAFGLVHFVMLFFASLPRFVLIRKLCCVAELMLWVPLSDDLLKISAWGYLVAVFVIVTLLITAVLRRRYTVWTSPQATSLHSAPE